MYKYKVIQALTKDVLEEALNKYGKRGYRLTYSPPQTGLFIVELLDQLTPLEPDVDEPEQPQGSLVIPGK